MSKVLVIDDDSEFRQMVKLVLQRIQCQVVEASNGRDGIARFEKERPDLIITDINMPEIDGLQTIIGIKKIDDSPLVGFLLICHAAFDKAQMVFDGLSRTGGVALLNGGGDGAVRGLHQLQSVSREALRKDYTIRVTFIGERHTDSEEFEREVAEHIGLPTYLTHFPLAMLPGLADSPMSCVDVHPPCRGKAEALRVLEERYGVPPERAVAVGDAPNDEPMIQAAGLGVAMGSGVESTRAVADRIIGDHDGPALAELVHELFL